MVCRITSTNSRRIAGVTLVDYIMGLAIGTLVLGAVCAFSLLNARGFASFSSYTSFDLANRRTMDQMTKDFRMVQGVTNFASNTISMVDYDGTPLKYYYNSGKQVLNRVKGGVTNTLLTDCTRLSFSMGMRDMTNATFGFEPTTNWWECKAIIVDWSCSLKLLGSTNEDLPQTHTVVIRN